MTQVVIGGIATSKGVESTARAAHEHGYNVILVSDAMTDLNPEAHEATMRFVFPALGEVGTSADVLSFLDNA